MVRGRKLMQQLARRGQDILLGVREAGMVTDSFVVAGGWKTAHFLVCAAFPHLLLGIDCTVCVDGLTNLRRLSERIRFFSLSFSIQY